MLLRPKLIILLLIVFLIIGVAVSLSLTNNLKKREFVNLQEENQRIVKTLTNEFFSDLKTWESSQIVLGPYSFQKTEVQEVQEKFIDVYQKITGQKIILFNIYNESGVIIASNLKELEGLKIANPNVEKALKTGETIFEFTSPEGIHLIDPGIKKKLGTGKIIEIYQPIEIEGERKGVIESYFLSELKLKKSLLEMIAVISLGFSLIVLIIYLFFSRFILKPIKIIGKATESIGQGIFSGYIKEVKQKDEIGKLAEDFNSMIRGLNSLSGEIARLKEVGRMKSEFISITAHQLRTPLSGIKWVLELALEKETSEELKKWLLKINDLNERMIEIISDLLNAARIEEGRFGYKFEEKTDLLALLDKIAKNYKMKMEEKNLKFGFNKENFANLYLKADPEKLEIAVNNLVENAINYTKKEGTIKIELEKTGGFVIIKIKDTGIGIAEEDLARLFGKFFRGQNAISAQPNGSGIGLFIAKNIIESHGGEIRAESKLNQGTIFYIKLPLVEDNKNLNV